MVNAGLKHGKAAAVIWRASVAVALLLVGVLGGLFLASSAQPSAVYVTDSNGDSSQQMASATVAAAGDIACQPSKAVEEFACQQAAMADLVADLNPDAVLTLGDNQYPAGSLADYQASYDKSWGQFKPITHPAPGNHEYITANAAGYFDYFGDLAGERGKGYYSFGLGGWQFIALNSEIDVSATGAQAQWLKAELAGNPTPCTIAYWHKPRFSSGYHPSDSKYHDLWQILYDNNTDIVLNGHSHGYERFVPQNPGGQYDPTKGIVQFVAGMGGYGAQSMNQTLPTVAARQNFAFGVLKLTLFSDLAKYQFVTTPGLQSFNDEGAIKCH